MKRRYMVGATILGAGAAGLVLMKYMSLSRQRRVVQPMRSGFGSVYHRNYWIDVAHSQTSVDDLMQDIKLNFAEYSPALLADFTKCKGADDAMRVGDEYDIKIFGPWNGMVRVTDVQPTSFEFATLEGHPEAGKIRFAFEHPEPDVVRFAIRSQARSRDALVKFTYEDLGAGKEAQKQTWVTFCERVAEKSGGDALGEVTVKTEEHQASGKVIAYED